MQPPHIPKSKAYLTIFILLLNSLLAHADDSLKTSSSNRINIFVERMIGDESTSNSFLGVHSFWWEYPNGLTIYGGQDLKPQVKSFFQKTRGINRFGGGANEISWQTCNGKLKERQPVKATSWLPPVICKFGVEDYLESIEVTGIKSSWLIANIAGINYREWSISELKENVKFAAISRKKIDDSKNRYWELGNELERGAYNWSPAKITERSNMAAAEISRADPMAKIIVPLIEFDAPQHPKRHAFNSKIISNLNFEVNGFSMHMYYDGSPGGPPIPKNIDVILEVDRQIQRILGEKKKIWITEHGRWPEGNHGDKNWKSSWHKTNDIEGVISTADFILATSQLEVVGGLMLHGVRAGPWNIFHIEKGHLFGLTGVGTLLEFLSPAFDGRRIITKTESTNKGGYKGGYDIRSSAFRVGTMIHLVVVNRAKEPLTTEVSLISAKEEYTLIQSRNLACDTKTSYCQNPRIADESASSYILGFEKHNSLNIRPMSVSHFVFEPKRKVLN